MKLINNITEGEYTKESNADSFIITNKKGGFYNGNLFSPNSKFNGLFFPYIINKKGEWDLNRTIESIGILKNPDTVEYDMSCVITKKNEAIERFFLNHSDSFIYEVENYKGAVPLFLDCKKIYDESKQGRIYEIKKIKDYFLISYKKYSDDSLSKLDYTFYIALKTNMEVEIKQKWIERNYWYDASRGDNSVAWVLDALQFNCEERGRVVISYALKRNDAIKKVKDLFDNTKYILNMKKKYVDSLSKPHIKLPAEYSLIYRNSIIGLDNLITEIKGTKGIYAGLPWFFHYWSRDEAISLGALICEEQFELVKDIIFRWVNDFNEPRISNRFPFAGLGSADATGWVFFRLKQLIEILDEKKLIEKVKLRVELMELKKNIW